MKNKFILAEYDLDDNLIDYYENYKEISLKWKTSVESVRCEVSRFKNNKINCIYDKVRKIPCKLYKIRLGDRDEK